jgi:hypothetical protein
VEGSDTLVIMTKAQASAMNNKFVQMKKSIDEKQSEYNGIKAVADSLTTLYTRSEATLQREKQNALEAKKQNNAELLARTLFLTWVCFTLTISNG